MEHEITHRYHQ